MKFLRQLSAMVVCLGCLAIGPSALAADAPKDLVLKNDAACTTCHDEADAPEMLAIGKTRHGTQADSRAPSSCTACHGTSDQHVKYKGPDKPPKPDVTFGARTTSSAQARNAACQECHTRDAKRSHWEGSTHQTRDVSCSSCHRVHLAKDPVLDKRTQSETCFTCHKEQRAQASKPSHHPVIEGKMSCSDCHNSHGSAGPSLMKRNSVVETCYTCHMEKRGPFVNNHQPVNEDCSICHNTHGTSTESMLKARPPFLCNTCHTPHGPLQPSLANGTAPVLAAPGWWNASVMTQGKSCVGCHAQIHGSSSPGTAGRRFLR